MILLSDRQHAIELIDEATSSGARLFKACQEMDMSVRTYQRWTSTDEVKADGRPSAVRPVPGNRLSQAERAAIVEVVNRPEYQSLPPSQIVPDLADQGHYIASESSFYRVLRDHQMVQHRGRQHKPQRRVKQTHQATGPNQVWCWDISWIPGPVKGMFYYLYLVLDIYSRKVVGWEIHEGETSDHASELIRKACLREQTMGDPLVLHSDNGSPMKGAALLQTLHELGVASSYSRPRVSNDNAYAEAMFRTVKYRPEYPHGGFAHLSAARNWLSQFVHWYNHKHKHRGLKFISPAERHSGQCDRIMTNRHRVYEQAKRANPNRWSGSTRNWALPGSVWLNPEKASFT